MPKSLPVEQNYKYAVNDVIAVIDVIEAIGVIENLFQLIPGSGQYFIICSEIPDMPDIDVVIGQFVRF